MEIFPGINLVMVAALSVITIGITDWFKGETALNKWIVRAINLGVSYGLVALVMLLAPMTWQIFVVSGVLVWLSANGVWHISKNVSK